MANLTSSDLSDPQPPVPGERERALVATRAHALGRRRRLAQGGGALAVVAAVAVSVAALTGGGTSGPAGPNRVEAASAAGTTASTPSTAATTAPTVATTVPAPVPAPGRHHPGRARTHPGRAAGPGRRAQQAAPVQPAAPTTFTLSGTVSGNPAGTTVTITVSGPGGEYSATADGAGNFSVSGLPAGDYQAIGTWVDSTNTATQAQRFGTVSIAGDSAVTFTFAN